MAIQYLQSLIAGLSISLIGSLPLGTLNIAAMQIAAKESVKNALLFATGVLLVEMAYLSITITLVGNIKIQQNWLVGFRVVSILFLLLMAIGSFMSVFRSNDKHIVLDSKMKRMLLGASMSAVNPLQVPFWLGWLVYLLSQSLIINSFVNNVFFVVSAGIGTFIALLLFIFAGRRFSVVMQGNKKLVNVLMGSLFVGMAVFQLIKLL